MPTYISLLRWTAQGVQSLKDSPSRLDAARKSFAAAGVRLKDFYMVTGQYDLVVVCEAPDYTAMAKAMLVVASHGNVHSETLRAFTEDEYRGIVSGL